jgi:hypothetical protein
MRLGDGENRDRTGRAACRSGDAIDAGAERRHALADR